MIQASPDGKSLGDCPFTQRANLALKVKGVRVTYILIDLGNKPKWYFAVNPAGTAPSLQFGDRVITDSYDIVQYLDSTYPTPSLKPPGDKEAEEVTGNVFNVFSAWAKNKDKSKEVEFEATFNAELKKIDDFLSQSKGPLLCGESWSVADCALVPRLYHIRTVAHYYKNYTKLNEFSHLVKYMEYAFATPEFKATDYPTEWVIAGWAKHFQ